MVVLVELYIIKWIYTYIYIYITFRILINYDYKSRIPLHTLITGNLNYNFSALLRLWNIYMNFSGVRSLKGEECLVQKLLGISRKEKRKWKKPQCCTFTYRFLKVCIQDKFLQNFVCILCQRTKPKCRNSQYPAESKIYVMSLRNSEQRAMKTSHLLNLSAWSDGHCPHAARSHSFVHISTS